MYVVARNNTSVCFIVCLYLGFLLPFTEQNSYIRSWNHKIFPLLKSCLVSLRKIDQNFYSTRKHLNKPESNIVDGRLLFLFSFFRFANVNMDRDSCFRISKHLNQKQISRTARFSLFAPWICKRSFTIIRRIQAPWINRYCKIERGATPWSRFISVFGRRYGGNGRTKFTIRCDPSLNRIHKQCVINVPN